MRTILAAVFAVVGVPLVVSALGTLITAASVDQRTLAMMQVIAGLLCILIAVVAGFTRPAVHVAPEPAPQVAPQPAAPAAADPLTARDRAGMGILVVVLALVLIALAQWLRSSNPSRSARTAVPVSTRPMPPAVVPAAGGDARSSTARTHAPSRARPIRADDWQPSGRRPGDR